MNETARINGQKKKVFRYEQIGRWIEVAFRQLKKGDKFRIYNLDGEPILINSQEIYIAYSDACQAHGEWTVEVHIAKNVLKTEKYTPKWFLDIKG